MQPNRNACGLMRQKVHLKHMQSNDQGICGRLKSAMILAMWAALRAVYLVIQ